MPVNCLLSPHRRPIQAPPPDVAPAPSCAAACRRVRRSAPVAIRPLHRFRAAGAARQPAASRCDRPRRRRLGPPPATRRPAAAMRGRRASNWLPTPSTSQLPTPRPPSWSTAKAIFTATPTLHGGPNPAPRNQARILQPSRLGSARFGDGSANVSLDHPACPARRAPSRRASMWSSTGPTRVPLWAARTLTMVTLQPPD